MRAGYPYDWDEFVPQRINPLIVERALQLKSKGWTQEEIAAKLEVSVRAVQNSLSQEWREERGLGNLLGRQAGPCCAYDHVWEYRGVAQAEMPTGRVINLKHEYFCMVCGCREIHYTK